MQSPAAWARVMEAQLLQTGLPLMGLPGLVVNTGMAGASPVAGMAGASPVAGTAGASPVGVQLIGARYREDLLLAAGAAIEAGGTAPMPAEPA